MKHFLGWLIGIGGMILGIYVGVWLLFIKPILVCCNAFDLVTLTGSMIGITIIKCIFATPVGMFIITRIGTIAYYIFES